MKKIIIGIMAILLGITFSNCGNNNRSNDNTRDSTLNSTTDSSYQNSNMSPTNPGTMSTDTMHTMPMDSSRRADTPIHR